MNTANKSLAALARFTDAFERSWSISADGIEERALFFCDTSVDAAKAIARAAKDLGIDNSLLTEWADAVAGSDAIGLALRSDKKSVRLYTQYWLAIAARVDAGNRAPFPLYRGFKSLTDGLVRRDNYICLPVTGPDVFWPPMENGFAALNLDPARGQEIFSDLNAETAIFTLTDGEGRKSWLTTVRRATIERTALAEWLAPLANRTGGAAVIEAARTSDLVHVAGGRDDTKGDFLTFYFESDRKSVLDCIQTSS